MALFVLHQKPFGLQETAVMREASPKLQAKLMSY